MDEDTVDLIIRLCTRAGMIMEDAAPLAITIGSLDEDKREQALAELRTAAGKIGRLLDAVNAL